MQHPDATFSVFPFFFKICHALTQKLGRKVLQTKSSFQKFLFVLFSPMPMTHFLENNRVACGNKTIILQAMFSNSKIISGNVANILKSQCSIGVMPPIWMLTFQKGPFSRYCGSATFWKFLYSVFSPSKSAQHPNATFLVFLFFLFLYAMHFNQCKFLEVLFSVLFPPMQMTQFLEIIKLQVATKQSTCGLHCQIFKILSDDVANVCKNQCSIGVVPLDAVFQWQK